MQTVTYQSALRVITGLLLTVITVGAYAQQREWPPPVWFETTPPFHIAGPLYYVGGRELTAYLLVADDCAMLVNVGMQENVASVMANVRTLGFDPEDIRYLLITQAHFDHAGGAQAVVKQTGAQVVAGSGDVALMRAGGLGDYVFADDLPFPAVDQVRTARDGETLSCGNLVVHAMATPGHTPGSTSWRVNYTDKDQQRTALIAASVSVLPQALVVGNQRYPQVVSDFRNTYKRLRSVEYDLYLPDHLVFIDPKAPDQAEPKASWFRNTTALPRWIQRSEDKLEALINAQTHH